MFKILINLWNELGLQFNEFTNFIIDNKLTSLFIVAILGLAISGLINSLKTNIIEYYLNKLFKTSNNNLIMFFTSFIQFLIIILILYVIYRLILKKIKINENMKANEQFFGAEKFNEISWKKDILTEIKTLNNNINHCKT
jgi:large-conductance mechanosensitive channel